MKLFHKKEIMAVYGLTAYEAQTLMNRVHKVNVGRGDMRPRWVVKHEDIEAYINKKAQRNSFDGLDSKGKLLRR